MWMAANSLLLTTVSYFSVCKERRVEVKISGEERETVQNKLKRERGNMVQNNGANTFNKEGGGPGSLKIYLVYVVLFL